MIAREYLNGGAEACQLIQSISEIGADFSYAMGISQFGMPEIEGLGGDAENKT